MSCHVLFITTEDVMGQQQEKKQQHSGSCHCGAVKFAVEVDASHGTRCNCSVCMKIGATTQLVKPAAFRLLAGEDDVGSYAWGAKVSTRFFCRHCGVHCFSKGFLEEVGGEFVSVNLNCLDGVDVNFVDVKHWDGRHNNWEAGPRVRPWPIG